jgi:hypothetical protein
MRLWAYNVEKNNLIESLNEVQKALKEDLPMASSSEDTEENSGVVFPGN